MRMVPRLINGRAMMVIARGFDYLQRGTFVVVPKLINPCGTGKLVATMSRPISTAVSVGSLRVIPSQSYRVSNPNFRKQKLS